MAINTQKFLPSSKGSAIVKVSKKTIKASSFVSNEKTKDVSDSIQKISKDYSLGFLSKRLLNDISFVRIKVIEIDKLLKGTLADEKKLIAKKKKGEEKKRFEKTENKLETKPNIGVGKLPIPNLPRMGILDWIKNFIKNVVIGYFAIRLIKYLPKIMPIVKIIASVADFAIDFGGKLLDGLVTFIDWAYKAHDATRGFLKNFGGENFVKLFDKFNGAIGALIETAIIAAIIASTQRGDSFIDTPSMKGGSKPGVKVTQGRGGSRVRPRLPGTGPTVTQGRGRLPGTRPGIPRLPGTGPTVTQGRGGTGIFSRINKFFSGIGSKITSRIPKAGPFAKLSLAMGKVGKLVGKAIPFAGAVIGITEGIHRLSKGDMIGAGLSFGSAIPLFGWGFLAADIIRSTVGSKTFDNFYLNNILPFLIPGVGVFVKQFLDKTGVTKKIIRQNEKNKQSQSIGFGEILKGFGGGYVKPQFKQDIKIIKSAEGGKVESQVNRGRKVVTRKKVVTGKNVVTRGGKVLGGVRRSIKSISRGKYRRKLSPRKPQKIEVTSPGINVGGEEKIFGLFPNPLKMIKDPIKKKEVSESNVMNPFNVIKKTGETLGKSDYFGPILSITSKILLGQKPEQQDYKNVGLGINLLVSKGIDEGKLKGGLMAAFAQGGFVDVKSLDAITEGGDISDWVSKTFKESTETNAQKTLREIQQNLKLKKEEKPEEETPSSEEPVLDDGGGGLGGSSYGSPEMKALLDVLAYAEGTTENRNGATGPPGYSTWAGYQIHGPTNLTTQTIQQVHDLQTSFMRAGKQRVTGSAVVGRYQFKDLKTHFAKQAGLKDTDLFSPANQDKMAIKEIERAGVTTEMLKRNGLTTAVMDKLAPIWASIPYSPKGGRSYYGQAFKNPQKLIELYNQKLKIKRDAAISRPGYSGSPDLSNVPRGDTSRAASRLLREFPRIRTRSNPQQIYASGLGFWMKKNFPTPGEPSRRGTGDYGDPAGGRDQMEHPDHGGVVASHRGRGHYIGRALDLGGFGGGSYKDQDYMWPYVVKFMKTYGLDSPSTLPQVWHAPGENYGPKHSGGPDGGHQNHLHVEFSKGGMTPSKSTYAIVGEKGKEFIIDADSTAAIESSVPGFLSAINKAKYIDATRVIKNYAVKEIISDKGFMSALNKSKYEEVSNIVSNYADRELKPKTDFLSNTSSNKYRDSIAPLSSYAEYESGSEQIVTIPQIMINNIISEHEEQSPMIMMGSGDGGYDPFESMYMMG